MDEYCIDFTLVCLKLGVVIGGLPLLKFKMCKNQAHQGVCCLSFSLIIGMHLGMSSPALLTNSMPNEHLAVGAMKPLTLLVQTEMGEWPSLMWKS